MQLLLILFDGLVGTDDLLVVLTLVQVGVTLFCGITGCHKVVLQFVIVIDNRAYLELNVFIEVPVGIMHVLAYVEIIVALRLYLPLQ